MNFSASNIRIITQNWSKDTKISIEGVEQTIEIKDSYSACYYCANGKAANFEELYVKNKSKGIGLSLDSHALIWHLPKNEHCMFFYIDSFDTNGVNPVAGKHVEPLADLYMEYDTQCGVWKSTEACNSCSIDWQWLKETFSFEPCSMGGCEIINLHHFFSILFARNMYDELYIREGHGQAIFEKISTDIEEIYKQRERSEYINQALEKEIIPPKFSELKHQNYTWVLRKKGNLEPKNGDIANKKEISIVYIDSGTEYSIQKGIRTFIKLMGTDGVECMDRMILYFLSSEGIKYYDKIYNTDINNPNVVHTVGEIN